MSPAVSVVIATDYFGTEEPCWDDVIGCARAQAAQDFDGPVEYLLPETRALIPRLPKELGSMLPGLRILPVDSDASYDFKNAGVDAASADIVAILDADCLPAGDWLSSLVDTMRARPEIAVVSGRTRYPGENLLQRLLNPLDRMFVDRQGEGPVSRISNNNAGYRRDAYLVHPLSNASGPFGGMLQVHAMLQDGHVLYFQPSMRMTHAFPDNAFERDLRRHSGYAAVMVRKLEPGIWGSWIVRLGYAGIPLMVLGRILNSWNRTVRTFRLAGLRWYEVPLVLGLSVVLHLLEIPGIWRAVRGMPIGATGYR